MINVDMYEVNEAYNMVEYEKLDVCTTTLGVSLLEYVNSNLEVLNERIYKKITTLAKNLVSMGQDIEADFGIPIVNEHISVTPAALMGGSVRGRPEDFVTITKTLDIAAKEASVNFVGGYPVLMSKSMTRADRNPILSIPQALPQTERVCSSVNVGSAKIGIDMDAMELMGRIVTETTEATRDHDSPGYAKLVILCNAPDDNPFMADASHDVTESGAIINVGVNGPDVMKVTLAEVRDANFEVLCETIKKTVFRITRMGQLVTQEASRRMGIPSGVIDLSLAPMPPAGDSVVEILEEIGLERVDASGTTVTFAMLNNQVKKGSVMASSYVDGLSGAFIPVSEDQGMIDVVSMRILTVEKLEATTCVCSVGLDTIATPGDAPSSTIVGTIADKAVIGMMNQKTTAVCLIPMVGKEVGGTVEFGGLLGYVPIMSVNTFSCRRSVTRGGRIPASVRSFKN